MTLDPQLKKKLDDIVASDHVVLFMKGNRSFPQCGFSASVVNILNTMLPKYTTVNILSDQDIRAGMKEYSDWPTFPQLFVRGEFVGGADIVRQMHENGELEKMLGELAAPAKPPALTVTARAAQELSEALKEGEPGDVIHLTITQTWEHQLDIGGKEAGRITVETAGITIQLDRTSAGKAAGTTIDFIDAAEGAGFKIDNPNRPAIVREIGAKELKALIDAGKLEHIYDVRTERERAVAKLADKGLLDDTLLAQLEQLPKQTPIAFYCHTGNRSRAAAQHLLKLGFTAIYNLAGGIDGWARDVDRTIARY